MITETTDYDKFILMGENRLVDLNHKSTRALAEQMVEHGWLDAFPLMARREGKKFKVLDGQHRLAIAIDFGIPVKYVECNVDIDVAKLNSTSKAWTTKDYVRRYMAQDNEHYNTLMAFHQRYGLPLTISAELLADKHYSTTGTRNGLFKVHDMTGAREAAEMVIYLKGLNAGISIRGVVRAYRMCRLVPSFDKARFLENAGRNAQALRRATGSKDVCLEVFEEIYNFHKRDRLPLKFEAEEAWRRRGEDV